MTENPWEEINRGRSTFAETFRGEKPPIFADESSAYYAGTLTANPKWRPTVDEPVPRVRCQYIRKRDGQPCSRLAIPGSDPTDIARCSYHGGTLPNVAAKAERVRAAAAESILDYVGDAVDHIGKTINDTSVPDNVRLAAAKDLLDRAGIKSADQVNVTVEEKRSPYEVIAEQIAHLRAGGEPNAGELESAGEEEVVDEDD